MTMKRDRLTTEQSGNDERAFSKAGIPFSLLRPWQSHDVFVKPLATA
jgi:hypothetical protein